MSTENWLILALYAKRAHCTLCVCVHRWFWTSISENVCFFSLSCKKSHEFDSRSGWVRLKFVRPHNNYIMNQEKRNIEEIDIYRKSVCVYFTRINMCEPHSKSRETDVEREVYRERERERLQEMKWMWKWSKHLRSRLNSWARYHLIACVDTWTLELCLSIPYVHN